MIIHIFFYQQKGITHQDVFPCKPAHNRMNGSCAKSTPILQLALNWMREGCLERSSSSKRDGESWAMKSPAQISSPPSFSLWSADTLWGCYRHNWDHVLEVHWTLKGSFEMQSIIQFPNMHIIPTPLSSPFGDISFWPLHLPQLFSTQLSVLVLQEK